MLEKPQKIACKGINHKYFPIFKTIILISMKVIIIPMIIVIIAVLIIIIIIIIIMISNEYDNDKQ